jgi:hypothetical protein
VNGISVDLFLFTLILHFFAQSSVLLMATWSFIEELAGSSSAANIAIVISKGSGCCVV